MQFISNLPPLTRNISPDKTARFSKSIDFQAPLDMIIRSKREGSDVNI